MEILSVYDSAFKPYGRVVEGYPTEGLVKALATTPCTDGVVYLPRVEVLHSAPNAAKIGEGLYGGMPYELGYCNGHNTKLNALSSTATASSTSARTTSFCCWRRCPIWRTASWTPRR